MLRTLWVAVSVLGSLAVADLGVAQSTYWKTYRTSSGCLFQFDSDMQMESWTRITWSGACASGQPISGRGNLDLTGPNRVEGGLTTRRWSGEFINGYWNGELEVYSLQPDGSRPTHREDFFRPLYNMGCVVNTDNGSPIDARCVPASASALTPRGEGAGNARPTQGATDTPSPSSSGGVRTALNAETGERCLTERILPIRERGYYFEHGVTITNSCNRSFRLEITEAPHNRPSHVRYTRLIEPNRSETYTCLQGKPNGQMAETAGCEGFLEYSYED